MRILFLMIAYPDVSKNSSMYTDLAEEFNRNGHDIYVVVANGPGKTSLKLEGNINVLRVSTLKLFNTSFIIKGLAILLLPFQVFYAISINFNKTKFDAIILPTPPITFLSVVMKLKKQYKSIVYLILRDIFPQNARDLGLIKSRFIYYYFRSKEKKLYSAADFIGCMSQGNIEYVTDHNKYLDPTKLHLLPNWKNVSEYTPVDYQLKQSLGFDGKFIILYGGNLGKPQEIEFIVEIAVSFKERNDVVFLVIGDGTEKNRMLKLCSKNGLKNVYFKEFLPRRNFEEIVKICDVGLIVNNRRFTIPNIPSRTLSYWEAKIPILAAIDSYTDYGLVLVKSQSGLWSLTGDIDAFRQNFEKLYSNKNLRIQMGENGYNYLISNCSTSIAYETIINKLT